MKNDTVKSDTMKNDTVNTVKRNRRWFQFSFRTLMIVVVLLSLPLAWLALEIRQAKRQSEVVEWIRDRGGYVLYDYQSSDDKSVLTKLSGRERLRKVIGQDLFADVTVVSLYKTQATDTNMKRLQTLTGLKELDIQATKVTDVGLGHLRGLKNLKTVLLGGDSLVTNKGIENLSQALPGCNIHR